MKGFSLFESFAGKIEGVSLSGVNAYSEVRKIYCSDTVVASSASELTDNPRRLLALLFLGGTDRSVVHYNLFGRRPRLVRSRQEMVDGSQSGF